VIYYLSDGIFGTWIPRVGFIIADEDILKSVSMANELI
jgi:hypothetical protein